ncbi:AVT1D [Scenedesmus sp. PABB004]|nr:AVT1D [Scenedesmus sp. PABB004]
MASPSDDEGSGPSSLRIPAQRRRSSYSGAGADAAAHSHEDPLNGHAAWPRSFQDAASWTARAPHVASSFSSSLIRTRHPDILEHEQEARGSPVLGAAAPSLSLRSSRLAEAGDLEETLLFEFEPDEAEAAQAALLEPSEASSDAGRALLSPHSAAGGGGASRLRSVIKDAAGGHVQAEVWVEEDRASSSTLQAAFNAVNILCGVGLLTTPYAMAISGLASMLLLVGVGAVACYTGRLLAQCMAAVPGARSYPDIGQAAFGRGGRLLVAVLLYLELFCCCVDFLILEGDNLAAVFPGAGAAAGGQRLGAKQARRRGARRAGARARGARCPPRGHARAHRRRPPPRAAGGAAQALILLAALVVLPSVWLRDLSLLSFLSVGGIFASVALLALVGWEGVTITGFPHDRPPLVTWSGVPVSLGLFCFCFSGHAVFPSLYASMRTKAHFPWLLVGSFSAVVAIYGAMAVLGALMFGSGVSENITLDMQAAAPRAAPTELLSLRRDSWAFAAVSACLRTALLAFSAAVAVSVPFFAAVSSLIGGFMSMAISIVLPCVFTLRICGPALSRAEAALAAAIACFGRGRAGTARAAATLAAAGGMVFSTLDTFFVSAEQLENSPSRKDGIDRDTEAELRAYGCALIQEAGILLAFQQAVMATGCVLFQRFFCKRSMKAYNVKKLAATALWQGAKLEEVPEVSGHPRELLNKCMVAIDRCIARREAPEGRKLGVLDLHSKEAEEFRRSLIRYELEMLKAFGFITHVVHPHKMLLNFCQAMGFGIITGAPGEPGVGEMAVPGFLQEALNVANDSLRTTLCVRVQSNVVACGIIFYVARKLQVPLPDDPPWWALFNVSLAQICDVCATLCALYRMQQPRFIPVCHQLLPSKPPTPATPASAAAPGGDAGATPMLSGAPRPGGKPLDPSVRLPVDSGAGGVLGATPQAAANGSAAAGSAPPSAAPSPRAREAGSAQRKHSRSRSPVGDDGSKRPRDAGDVLQAAGGATAAAEGAAQPQARRGALFPPLPGGGSAGGGGQEAQPRGRDSERDRERERERSSRGRRERSRSRDRDRDRSSRHSRRSRSRSRSRERGRAHDGRDRSSTGRRDDRERPRHHHERDRDRDRRDGDCGAGAAAAAEQQASPKQPASGGAGPPPPAVGASNGAGDSGTRQQPGGGAADAGGGSATPDAAAAASPAKRKPNRRPDALGDIALALTARTQAELLGRAGAARTGGAGAAAAGGVAEHLLGVKARLLASLEEAVAEEAGVGATRLAAKQAEAELVRTELAAAQAQLERGSACLARLAGGYAAKAEAALDARSFAAAWFIWRAHIARQRRLARQALAAQHFYVRRWLLGRAWARWAGAARRNYRKLVADRAAQQRASEVAALGAAHDAAAAALRAEVEALQAQLAGEAEARAALEEEYKRAFMRGVTAINLEAVTLMRRGAPPAGANPFPVALPLRVGAAAAAEGLAEAAARHGAGLAAQLDAQAGADAAGAAAAAAGRPASAAAGRSPGAARAVPGGQGVDAGAGWGAADGAPEQEEEWARQREGAVPEPHPGPAPARLGGLATWGSGGGAGAGALPRVVVERGPRRPRAAAPRRRVARGQGRARRRRAPGGGGPAALLSPARRGSETACSSRSTQSRRAGAAAAGAAPLAAAAAAAVVSLAGPPLAGAAGAADAAGGDALAAGVAWALVGVALAASLLSAARAFAEAKGAIDRREAGAAAKKAEADAAEAARKQRIKDIARARAGPRARPRDCRARERPCPAELRSLPVGTAPAPRAGGRAPAAAHGATMSSPHRPASAWLTQLQRAKTENSSSVKPKITIQDVAERANGERPAAAAAQAGRPARSVPRAPPPLAHARRHPAAPAAGADADGAVPAAAALIPTSPRSIEACFRLGVDPLELAFRPASAFRRAGESEELAALRFQHHEQLRQERIKSLMEERKALLESGGGGGEPGHHAHGGGAGGRAGGAPGGGDPEATSAMIAKEQHKLDVLKRRQERDIQQMLQYEITRKALLEKQQKKIDALEARAAELQRQKAEHEKAWAAAQRERELQKLAEEQERDREAGRLASESYRREREMQRKEAEEARARKKQAFLKEMERREKVEEARRETDRILAAQEAEVAARKAAMDARDRERLARMATEAEERAAANAAKKKKAEERIAAALEMNSSILRQKRTDFERREAASEARRAELEAEQRRTDELKRQAEAAKEAERAAKYQLALAREEERKMDIQERAERKDHMLALVNAERCATNDRKRIERELFDSLRRDKVDSIQKMQAYQRQLLLEKIMDENDKTAALLEQRQAIQAQRKAANMAASLHRNKVNQMMESMRNVHNIEKLAPGGTVDAGALASQLGRI